MRLRVAVWSAALLLALAGSAHAQARADVKDPAELLPEQTLFYSELWDNPQLIKEIQGLLKGSALEDMPAALARFHEKLGAKDHNFPTTTVGGVGIMLSPEVLAELGRIRGTAFAVTGVTKDGQPTFVSIVLTGDSQLVPLMMRSYLCTSESVRSVGEVDGVRIYQDKIGSATSWRVDPPPGFKPGPGAPPGPGPNPVIPPPNFLPRTEVAMAMLPGMLVFGSTPDSVKDVVRRAQGDNKTGSLSQARGFQTAAKLREGGGGLFVYADFDTLVAKLEGTFKKGTPEEAQWEKVKSFANPKAFHAVAGSFMLRNGGIDVRLQLTVDTREAGPIVEVLPDQPANLELLRYLPRNCLGATVVSLPEGEKRWEKILALADNIAKASKSDGPLPSKQVEDMETKLGVHLGKDVLGKIKGMAFGVSTLGDTAKGGSPLPLVVIEATDEEAAAALEDLVPKFAALAPRKEEAPKKDEAPKPVSQEIDGQKVFALTIPGVPGEKPLQYGHRGKILIFAEDPRFVAAALTGGAGYKGLLSRSKVAAAVKELDQPIYATLWLIPETIRYAVKEAHPKPGAPAAGADDKFDQEMLKLADKLPPFVSSIQNRPDGLTVEMRQSGLRNVSPKLIDVLVDKGLEQGAGAEGTKESKARLDITHIQQAVEVYKVDTGEYPESLTALTRSVGGKSAYLEPKDLLDPWGQPYVYEPQNRDPKTQRPRISSRHQTDGKPLSNW